MNAEAPTPGARWRSAWPAWLMVASIPLALLVLIRLDWAQVRLPTPSTLVGAALLHGLAVLLLGYLWKCLLLSATRTHVTWPEVISHIGATLAGKYLPGKVWGLISRGAMLSRRSLSVADTVAVSVFEQGVLMHAAAVFAAVSWGVFIFATEGSLILLLCAIVFSLLSIGLVCRWLPDVISSFHPFLARLKMGAAVSSPVWRLMGGRHYWALMLGFSVYWGLLGAVLWQLSGFATSSGLSMVSLILATVPIAVVAGFLALWMPGGIGVREGVIVTLLVMVIPLEQAIGLSLLFRCWCILVDIVMGGLALLFYRSGMLSARVRQEDV